MSAPAVEDEVCEEERAWRQGLVSLVITGSGTSGDLAPRFPVPLPADLPCRFASVSYRADFCVLSLHLEAERSVELLAVLRTGLREAGYRTAVDEPLRVHAAPPRVKLTASLELEALPSGLRVVWWLDDAQMTWLLDDQVFIERAQASRKGGRQGA